MRARTRAGGGRWAVSLADLCLLLLGFFVIVQAQRGPAGAVSDSLRRSFGGGSVRTDDGYAATGLFVAGEAVFLPGAAARLRLLGAQAGTRRVTVESSGADAGAKRFDAWELAAARAASVARAVAAGGADPGRIDLVMLPARTPGAQRISVRFS